MWCEAPLLELAVTQSVVPKYLEIAEGSHNQMFTCFQKIKLQSILYYQLGIFSKAWIPPIQKIPILSARWSFSDLFGALVAWLRLRGNKSWCSCHWLWIIFSLNLGIWQYNSLGSHFLPFLLSSSKENK